MLSTPAVVRHAGVVFFSSDDPTRNGAEREFEKKEVYV